MFKRTCIALLCLGIHLPSLVSQAQSPPQSPPQTPTQSPAQLQPKKQLTLDRLYSLPSLIGTRPESPQWAPDSSHVAFLWNDEGMPFLDLWTVSTSAGSRPVRLTGMPHPAAPVDPGTDITKLQAQARFETDHGIAALAWSADSTRIFFTLHGKLYSVLPGSKPQALAPDGIAALLPAPSGNALAYITSTGALSLLPQPSANPIALYTPPAQDVAIEEAHWSPDSTQLAIVETDSRGIPVRGIPDYLPNETTLTKVRRAFPGEPSETRRLGIVSTTAGAPTRWLPLPGEPMDLIHGVGWSPNGRSLLVDRSDLYIKHRRLLQIDAATAATRTLVQEDDPSNVTAEWWSAWAPDGQGVYYTSDQPPANDYAVFYKSLGSDPPHPVLLGNYAVFDAQIPTGIANTLFATANPNHPEQRQILQLNLQGQPSPHTVSTMPGTHTAVASPNGRFLADVFSSDTAPPDLYLQPTAGNVPAQRITTSPLPEFNDYRWVAATYVTFPNVHDGVPVTARMTRLPGVSSSRALILGSVYSNTARNQWGGRIYHPTWGLDQYLVQQGYVLLNPDIRGSSGHGRAFRQRLALDYGGIDTDDLYSATQYLVKAGIADAHRIGMWGSSYGGLLTTTSLFTHPETYQAGVAGAPATSLFHAETGEMRTMMDPQTHPEQYTNASSFPKSGNLQGHLMLLQGMRDDVVLFKDSVTLTERLILQGKDITLTPLPDAPHGWDTLGLAQARYGYRKIVDYFNRWIPSTP